MTTLKPVGGKEKGAYVMFPEEWFNKTIRVEAKKRGVGTDECCEQIVREYFHETVT